MFSTRKILLLVPLSTIAALGLMPAIGNAATAGDIGVTQVLNTSPLWADSGSYHSCNVVNVTTSSIGLAIELIGSNGSVITSVASISLPAGESTEILDATASAGASYVGFARCRFTLNYASGGIRANETVFTRLSSGNYQSYAVSEAR